jgi:glutaminyl-peptide cyclotransferase
MRLPLWFASSRNLHRTSRLALLLLLLVAAGCPQRGTETVAEAAPATTAPRPAPTQPTPAELDPAKPQLTRRFSGTNAWQHLTKQVAFGPRVPNKPGHRACRKYLEAELLKYCDRVEQQEFETPHGSGPLKMVNLIGRFDVQNPRRIILAAHWDTRPTADLNPPGLRDKPIDGANDGASGVAVLLELARLFKEQKPPVGIDIVLFDGEDYGPGLDMMFLGAKHFAKRLSTAQVRSYNYGILLDMVGDRNLDIHAEEHSHVVAPLVFDTAYEVSRALGYKCFKRNDPYQIFDDHLPLIERGVKMYDFIDFTYEPWHTTEDTVDKCSKESLEMVGRTVENMIYFHPAIYGELPKQ